VIFDSIDVKYLKTQLDKLGNLNITLTQLRDDLRGTGNRTLTDLYNQLTSILGQLDVALSTRASEATLASIANALASTATDKLRTSIVDPLPTGDNWIGRVKIGDGTSVASVIAATLGGASAQALAVAPDLIKMLSGGTNYVYSEIVVSTTEAYSTFSPEIKFAVLSNRDNTNDIFVRFNDPTPATPTATQITIPAGTAKVVMFPISTLNYSSPAGTPTLVVNGFQ